MTIGMRLMPSESSMMPKVKRRVPYSGSVPTVASSSPRAVDSNPRKGSAVAATEMTTRENSTTMLYSGGPICRATAATGAARKISTRSDRASAVTEENSAVCMALPLLPCMASG